LKPGGYHIMLINLARDLKAGEAIKLTLVFQNAGKIAVTAQIR
jgi:periplasmic copper chaperone A